jgi:hypothetical protein
MPVTSTGAGIAGGERNKPEEHRRQREKGMAPWLYVSSVSALFILKNSSAKVAVPGNTCWFLHVLQPSSTYIP